MNRNALILLSVLTAIGGCGEEPEKPEPRQTLTGPPESERELEQVTFSEGVQLTGITVTDTGRTFVNFPRWRDIPYSVVEVMDDGSFVPYPNEAWNSWTEEHEKIDKPAFVSVQSVVADGGNLWVLDPASPGMKGVVESGAKLVKIDLGSDRVERIYRFNREVAPTDSYLNDVRIDNEHNFAYITDSGLGGLVALDLESGGQRHFLREHPSTKAEDIVLSMAGEPLRFLDGGQPQIHSDGIALDERRDLLYYHALTGYQLYRVPTRILRDRSIRLEGQRDAVENLGETPAPDGMLLGPNGNLYMGDLENQAVVYRSPDGNIYTLVQDPALKWPDSFSIGPGGWLYFTDSRIQDTEWFVENAEVSTMRFPVYRVKLPQ